MISDAQVHVWTDDRPMAADAKPHLPFAANAEYVIKLMEEAGVDRAVLNPLYLPDMSSAYGLEAAHHYPDRFKVMGWLQPALPNMLQDLDHWLDDPGMCSIRFSFANPAHADMVKEGAVDPYWDAVQRNAIPVGIFTIQSVQPMVPTFEKYPGIPFIIDHINMPQPQEAMDAKISELVSLARLPNVVVKFSSLPQFSKEPYPFNDLLPHVHRLFDAFGTDRMMWGTDVTQQIARNTATYRQHVTMVTEEYSKFLSPSELDQLMNGTFARVFRWP